MNSDLKKISYAKILVLPGAQFIHQIWPLLLHGDSARCSTFIFAKPQTAFSALGRRGVLRQLLTHKHMVKIYGFLVIETRSYAVASTVAFLNTLVEASLRVTRVKPLHRLVKGVGENEDQTFGLTLVDLVAFLQESDLVKQRAQKYLRRGQIISTYHSLDLMPHTLSLLKQGRPEWVAPVTFLATSSADQMGYEIFYRSEFDQIIQVEPPRFANQRKCERLRPEDRPYILLLLQSRSPKLLGLGPTRESQRDLVRAAKELSAKWNAGILVRPHPSMSSFEVRSELFFSGLYSRFEISRSVGADEILKSRVAITDFSGLTPDCVAGGCPVIEVRLNFRVKRPDGFKTTQALAQVNYDYDYFFKRGLCSRLSDFSQLEDLATSELSEVEVASKKQHLAEWLASSER